MKTHLIYEIGLKDVGKDLLEYEEIQVVKKKFYFYGKVLPHDVGKRIYKVGDIYQVENDEQLLKRRSR